jgi:hypothetical protein
MNNKVLTYGLAIGVGCAALFSSGYVTMSANESGYNLYKSAWKNTKQVQSFTGNLDVTLEDNGNKILAVDSVIKKDLVKHVGHGDVKVTVANKNYLFDFFNQKNQNYLQLSNGELYSVGESEKWKHHQEGMQDHNEDNQIGETIVDALLGNIKQQVKAHTENGVKKVSMQLSEKQIPTVVQAFGSVAVQKSGKQHDEKSNPMENHSPFGNIPGLTEDIQHTMPHLQKDVKIKSLEIQANINKNNLIEKQTAKVIFIGKDASGKNHEITLNIQFDLSQLNQTKPETLDLKGKKVHTISHKQAE